MLTTLKGTNIVLTEEIKSYLDSKLATLDKFIDPNDEAYRFAIELAKETERHKKEGVFKAEATLLLNGKQHRAVSLEGTLHNAIDGITAQLHNDLSRAKQKERGAIRRTGLRVKDMMRDWRNWRF